MESKTHKSQLIEKEFHTDGVLRVVLKKPNNFDYKAGQFVQFMIPDTIKPPKKIKRSYSLCSTPKDENIEFCVKILPDGCGSNYFKDLKEGDEVEIMGPFGKFVLGENFDNNLFFIATGVGIAPIIGLLKESLVNLNLKKEVFLLFGVRYEGSIFLVDYLDNLKQTYSNFDYKLTLSQPSDKWTGAKGRVTNHLEAKIDKDTDYYLCGSMEMIAEVRKNLENSGVKREKIHFEIF